MSENLAKILRAAGERMQANIERCTATVEAVDAQCDVLGAGHHHVLVPLANADREHNRICREVLEKHRKAEDERPEMLPALTLLVGESFDKVETIFRRWKPSVTSVDKVVASVSLPTAELKAHNEALKTCVEAAEKNPKAFMVTFRQKGFDGFTPETSEWSLST